MTNELIALELSHIFHPVMLVTGVVVVGGQLPPPLIPDPSATSAIVCEPLCVGLGIWVGNEPLQVGE